jgi:taurine dioxygenase
MTYAQLERFTESLGPFGHDPYITPVPGHPNILEVRHDPDEAAVPFGSSWHSDWSFQAAPPNATLLHAKVVPPIGGGTHFADGIRALETLPKTLRQAIEGKQAVHSARRPYSHEGYRAGGKRTSMKITPNEDAWQTQDHPIIRTHPESGRQSLFLNPVYTLGIKDMDSDASSQLLQALFAHMLHPDFVYQHHWAENMLILWDNRTVMHSAQGGYSGYRRVMHRTTVAGSVPV